MAKILNAEPLYAFLKKELKDKIAKLSGIKLASVRVCKKYCSDVYFFSQKKLAQDLGIGYVPITLNVHTSMANALSKIETCNRDKKINGIIVNKPFPESWKEEVIFSRIDPRKDIEGMNPSNLGKLVMGQPTFISPTVLSTFEFLKMTGVDLYGKDVVIVGFSSLIGKPLALLLGKKFATVTIAHIATFEKGRLEHYLKGADIVISAVGKPHLIKGEWIKKGAIVIDVGIGEKDGRIVGDVDFIKALDRASYITPVPGGVGKLTTLFLFKNLLSTIREQSSKS